MTTAAELAARTDCADLRAANAELQRQNDILTGRVDRLNKLLVLREREIDKLNLVIEALQAELDAARAGLLELSY